MLEEFYKRAQACIQTGDLDQARTFLLLVISEQPNNVDALNDLAVVELMEDKCESGIELLNEVLLLDPENIVAPGNLEYAKSKLASSK